VGRPLRPAGGLWGGNHPGDGRRLRLRGPVLGPRRVWVGSDAGASARMAVPIQLALSVGWRLNGRQEPTPEASLRPAVEAAGPGPPGAIARGALPPGSSRAQNPEQAVENAAMIAGRATRVRLLWRAQRLQPPPWRRR
jgi:hypothetical protein